jgi:hypothetical protein
MVRSGTVYKEFLGIDCRLKGTETKTKFLLGLGVRELD